LNIEIRTGTRKQLQATNELKHRGLNTLFKSVQKKKRPKVVDIWRQFMNELKKKKKLKASLKVYMCLYLFSSLIKPQC